MAEQGKNVTIDGVDYAIDELSQEARVQLTNLQVTDREIAHVQQRLAIFQTARTAYANALKAELPKTEQ